MRLIEVFIEGIGWLKIVASPLIIGSIIGGLIFLKWRTDIGLIAGCFCALVGLIIGIFWATSIWRKYGTMNFLSRVNATPELDKKSDH